MVASLPSLLPLAQRLLYVQGQERLLQQQVLLKQASVLNTLTQVSTFCFDKTGTLTENQFQVQSLFLPELETLPYEAAWAQNEAAIPYISARELLRCARLNCETLAAGGLAGVRRSSQGDPMELALFEAAPASLEKGLQWQASQPFDSLQRRSAMLYQEADSESLAWFIKGAPEQVLQNCQRYMKPNGEVADIPLQRDYLFRTFNNELDFAQQLRVLALAIKPVASAEEDPYEDAIFLGWVCLVDPARPGAKEALQLLQELGVKPLMLTGDQKATALSTALHVGLASSEDEVALAETLALSTLRCQEGKGSQAGSALPASLRVVARTRPEDKLHIIEALQQRGEVVAMVGDGVNDLPALAQSNLGVAMPGHNLGGHLSSVASTTAGAAQEGTKANALQPGTVHAGTVNEGVQDAADIVLLNNQLGGLATAFSEALWLKHQSRCLFTFLLSSHLALLGLLAGFSLLQVLLQQLQLAQGFGLHQSLALVLWLSLLATLPTLWVLSKLQPPLAQPSAAVLGSGNRPPGLSQLLFWATLLCLPALGLSVSGQLLGALSPQQGFSLGVATFTVGLGAQLLNALAYTTRCEGKRLLVLALGTPALWACGGFSLLLVGCALYVPALQGWLGLAPPPVSWLAGALLAGAGLPAVAACLFDPD
jgi:Ca2+-transporting ATPase